MPVGARRVLVSGRGSTPGFSLTAPDPVVWVSGSSVAQAVFQVTPDPDVEALMRVYGEISTDSGFGTILETTYATIESPDFDDLVIDDFAFAPLVSGTYYARFWTASAGGVQNSAKSVSVTQTISLGAFFAPRYFPNRYFAERYFG